MSKLTYAQASVLCRVEGMPYEVVLNRGIKSLRGHPRQPVDYLLGEDHYRLTPLAPLTANQAAICLAMGVAVEVHYGNGGKWRPCRIGDCCPSVHGHSTTSLRVPPESEEA